MIATSPVAENPNIENTAISRKVSRVLGMDLQSWERLMLLSLAVAGFMALIIAITTTSVVILQRREAATAKKEFDEYKLSVEGKVADAKREGIEAGKIAGNALVRQAEFAKEAETARLQTEQIKQVVAWRALSPQQVATLKALLSIKPGSVNLRFTNGDPEALFFATQISQVLSSAGWRVAPGSGNSNAILFGLHLPDSSTEDTTTLRSALTAAQIPFSTQPLPDTGSSVEFNVSTIHGAPTLVIGSKHPPILR